MNTKDIEKREELCRLLNMDFDEAGELFSDETMQSMQMAQVNGGGFWGELGKILLEQGVVMATQLTISHVINQLQTAPTAALAGKPFSLEEILSQMEDIKLADPNATISFSLDSVTTNVNGGVNYYGIDLKIESK